MKIYPEKIITVITPTYNRANKIENLYQSLQNQTQKNFEWLIIDDGSSDNTKEKVFSFSEKSPFPIKYIYKENGGKHTALNLGIKTIETELTFIVDSDDVLLPDCMETIDLYYKKYKTTENLGVLSFLRSEIKQGVILKMPTDEHLGSYVADRVKIDRAGDMAEVFVTKVLKSFPFPEFEGERFLSEDVVWIQMGMKYKTAFINKAIYLFEYLPDGLTRNDKSHKFASPLGSMLRGIMLMKNECGAKANLKGAIIYNCYKYEAQKLNTPIPKQLKPNGIKEKTLLFLTKPIGRYYNKKWKT